MRYAGVNDLPVGRSVDEVLRLVQAFQFVDKHGEVCPATWTPGAKTVCHISLLLVLDSPSQSICLLFDPVYDYDRNV